MLEQSNIIFVPWEPLYPSPYACAKVSGSRNVVALLNVTHVIYASLR